MNEWNFFAVVQQVLVALTILSQIYVAFRVVILSNGAEQFVRVTAVSAGVLIFLGSKAFDVTFADLMFLAVTDASLYQVIISGTIVPVLVGIAVAHATISAVSSGSDFAIRIMLLVGVFTLVQISYFNYVAITQTSLSIDKALLPNLCYSLAVSLWIIFNYEDDGQFTRSRY